MKIVEMVGILVLQCERCGKKFVVNSETVKEGFQCVCDCNNPRHLKEMFVHQGSSISISIQQASKQYANQSEYNRYERSYGTKQAMPLEEYKRMLAGVILEGKKYKVANQHKNAVNVKVDTADYENLYATLRNLGFSKEESIAKVDIAIDQGFVRDTEIIKYILSMS